MSATIETLGLKVNIDGLEAVREATEALNALAAAAVRAQTALDNLIGQQTITVEHTPPKKLDSADFERMIRRHDQRRA